MTITEIIRHGLHYARTCRSLWLFGFFVGIASGGSNSGGGGNQGGDLGGAVGAAGVAIGSELPGVPAATLALFALVVVAAIAAGVMLRFIGEGALIEGIVRARQGTPMTTREGFRAGWAHWGVLLRIGLLYVAATAVSVAVVVGAAALAWWALGPLAAVATALPSVVVLVPWLVTLFLLQAFASRIAVLEDRHALDAIRAARLFLHGRLGHGLRLMVASFLGTFVLSLAGAIVLVPVALLLVASIQVLSVMTVVILGALLFLPAFAVFTAIVGTFRSSVWTIGYVTQVEA